MSTFELPKEAHPDFSVPGKQPVGPADIDWGIASKSDLVCEFLGGQDLVDRRLLDVVGGPSRVRGGFAFDGTNDALVFDGTKHPSPGIPYTVIADVMCATTGTSERIFSSSAATNYTGVVCYKDSTDMFSIIMGGNTGTNSAHRRIVKCSTTTFAAGIWHRVAMSVTSATTAIAYIDGVKQTISTSGTAGSVSFQGASPASLGRWFQGGSYIYGAVNIREFSLRNGALTESEARRTSLGGHRFLKPRIPISYFIPAGGAVTAKPLGHQQLDNQHAAIAASRLNGVLQ